MKTTLRTILILMAVAMLALAMSACKSESSPTAPPSTSTAPPGGSVIPPTGATVTLSVSSANPLVSSKVTVTATVSVNGNPAPDGTAVQFTTTLGTFADSGQNTTIRITKNGVATADLTAGSAGTATITATVNNVTKTTSVTFVTQPVIPPPPNTAPTISSVSPAFGVPGGGQLVTITGTNFRAPVRVLFDPGNGQTPKEASVQQVSATSIVVVTPPFDIVTGQTLPVTITVIDEAGTAVEQKVVAANAFTYQLAVLTPAIRGVTPTSGPIDGNTQVKIIGDAFQAPVQVFFGAAEAQVVNVKFDEIIVISPAARDTSPNGSGAVTGPVDIKVLNVGSGKQVVATAAFRYIAKMQITAAGPTEGPFTGGTRVTIDGVGFNDPIAISIAGVAAQPIKVSGSQIVAVTSGVQPNGCADVTGPIVITNVDNGDTATGPTFIYRIVKPQIVGVGTGSVNGTTTVTVANAVGPAKITIGTSIGFITGSVVNPNGTTTYTVQIPASVPLATQSCPAGGSIPVTTAFDVTYASLVTSCSDTAPKALMVSPQNQAVLFVGGSFTPFVGKITPGTAGPPATPPTVTVTPTSETVSLVNNGTAALTINSISTTSTGGNGCGAFNISASPSAPATLNACDPFAISVNYKATTTPTVSADQCRIDVSTSLGPKSFTVSGSSQ